MSSNLAIGLDKIARIAQELDIDPQLAKAEGLALSAAVAEPAAGAFIDWAKATDQPVSAEAFMTAASQGRRWRSSPTPIMSELRNTHPKQAEVYAVALADICAAACELGEPTPLAAGAASLAAAAQLGPVPAQPVFATQQTPSMDQSLFAPVTTFEPPSSVQPPADFSQRAPGMLQQVLDQLRRTQDSLRTSGLDLSPNSDSNWLSDPHAPGAFDLLGNSTPTPHSGGSHLSANTQAEPTADQSVATMDPVTAESADSTQVVETKKSLDELMAELEDLIGLQSVKEEIKKQAAILRIESLRTKEGLKAATITRHLIFTGNPGTGKTTVARLVAGIYQALGLLTKGQLVEVDRSELVAGYLGQTAIKTTEVIKKAEGGVLFIDEAYSLNGDQYGEEAINTLVKEMEDKRDDLVVIVAGYPLPMAEFIAHNPGLNSRFRTTIEFENYSDDEVVDILKYQAARADYDIEDGAEQKFRSILTHQVRDFTFGNGRFARNMLEAAIGRHAWRLREVPEPNVYDLRTLLPIDFAEDTETVAWPDQPDPQSDQSDLSTQTDHNSFTDGSGSQAGKELS